MGATNDCAVIPYYFYHGTIDHPYVNEVAKKEAETQEPKIRKLYCEEDSLTKQYLNMILSVRKKGIDELYPLDYYGEMGKGVAYFCDPSLAPKGDVTFVDVGAYDGDSIEPIRKFYKDRLKKCYAFEPNEKSRGRLGTYLMEQGLDEITSVYPYARARKIHKFIFRQKAWVGKFQKQAKIIS